VSKVIVVVFSGHSIGWLDLVTRVLLGL